MSASGAPKLPPLRVNPQRPASGRPSENCTPQAWRLSNLLLLAPHRLGFFMVMVTRVACGHSGRPLVADRLMWGLFWALQLAVLLSIAGALQQAPPGVRVAGALVWACVVAVWGLRLMGWFGRLRADGRPG